jgi:hypothetical protein
MPKRAVDPEEVVRESEAQLLAELKQIEKQIGGPNFQSVQASSSLQQQQQHKQLFTEQRLKSKKPKLG